MHLKQNYKKNGLCHIYYIMRYKIMIVIFTHFYIFFKYTGNKYPSSKHFMPSQKYPLNLDKHFKTIYIYIHTHYAKVIF